MKIKNLSVRKLYGHFDYKSITFNDDITFLYGLNGSGKTTILNILGIILSGNIYKLFEYEFEEIYLKYFEVKTDEEKSLIIEKNSRSLKIKFNEKLYNVNELYDNNLFNDYLLKKQHSQGMIDLDSVDSFYHEKYHFFKEIRETFCYVYLPLDRISKMNDMFDEEKYIYSKQFYDKKRTKKDTIILDNSMKEIEELVKRISYSLNNKIRKIDVSFRNSVLKSLVNVKTKNAEQNVIDNLFGKNKINPSIVSDIQEQYISILTQLDLISSEEADLKEFFDKLLDEVNVKGKKTKFDLSTMISLNELTRIREIVKLANDAELRKKKANYPIELFLETVNSFINEGSDYKKIQIENGEIYFKTKYSRKKIPIALLSSGEKQLLTFFANLIFRLNVKGKGSIYIVDEPELSLHLAWQKKFVEKALSINSDVQFIFATHAPEIVSYRRDKLEKLIKDYED